MPLIEKAVNSIDIIVYDWRWYRDDPGASAQLFNQTIVRAVRRGVKVRAIVNNNEIARVLKEVGCEARRLRRKELVHCKFMVIDDKLAITGSHNYTEAAFQKNLEVSVIFDDMGMIESLKNYFQNLWLN